MKNIFLAALLMSQSYNAIADTDISFKTAKWALQVDYLNATLGRSEALALTGEVIFNDKGYCLLNISTTHLPCEIQKSALNNIRNDSGVLVSLDAYVAIISSEKYIELLNNSSEKKSFSDKAIHIFQEFLATKATTGVFVGYKSLSVDFVKNPETIPSLNSEEMIELISYPGAIEKL